MSFEHHYICNCPKEKSFVTMKSCYNNSKLNCSCRTTWKKFTVQTYKIEKGKSCIRNC